MSEWNAALHPRGPHGQFRTKIQLHFRPKLSHSIRVSPISVSYNAGARAPIVPGRATLYLGVLARVERTGGNNFLQRHVETGVNKAFGRHSESSVARVLKGHELTTKSGLRVRGPSNVINTPSFRVSSTASSRSAASQHAAAAARVSRPRAPRVPRAVRSTARTAAVPALPAARPSRRRARRKLSGTRVHR
jgi:hypothetical protein